MNPAALIVAVVALVLFLLAVPPRPVVSINLVAAGLACLTLAWILALCATGKPVTF